MVNRLTCLVLLILLIGTGIASAQDVDVQVDRSEIARGETLTLTITVTGQQQNSQLDLSALQQDFDVLATRTNSQITALNNQVRTQTDYIITLFPTREGELVIPGLEIAGETSPPIRINVVDAGPNSNQPNNELFLETEVNKESVYVQEQLLFTIRLFYKISGIRNPQFTELDMPDTVIEQIGSPNQYERQIQGERYGVYERRYVIFPQRSGQLEIPDILFRGEVTDGSSNFVFRNPNTERVTAFIDGMTIDVKERPPAAQSLEYWLPATNLTIAESFEDSAVGDIRIGETVTRIIELQAEGLDGAMIPPFSPTAMERVNLYPGTPDVQRNFVDGRIVGSRTERTQIVPTESGEIEIPEVSIPWWNVETDELQFAVIPASRLNVGSIDGTVPVEQALPDSNLAIPQELDAPVLDQDMLDQQAQERTVNVSVTLFNAVIAAALLAVLIAIYLLVIRKLDLDPVASLRSYLDNIAARRLPENNEPIAFKQLLSAIRRNDAANIRSCLITWSSHRFAPKKVATMEDVLRYTRGSEIEDYCLQVQSALYYDSEINAESKQSVLQNLAAMRQHYIRSSKVEKHQQNYALPPLYKT